MNNRRFSSRATNRVAVTLTSGKRYWLNAPKSFLRRSKSTTVATFKPDAKPVKNVRIRLNIPGANYIFDSNKNFFSKLFWFLIVTFCITTCCYQIFNRVDYYLSNPTTTRTIVMRSIIKFPSLTICRPLYSPIATYPLLKQKSKGNLDCEKRPLKLMPELNLSTIWKLMNTEGLIVSKETIALRKSLTNVSSISSLTSSEYTTTEYETIITPTMIGTCKTFLTTNPDSTNRRGYRMAIEFEISTMEKNPCGEADEIAWYLFHRNDEDITYHSILAFGIVRNNSVIENAMAAKQFTVINQTDSPCHSVDVVSQCKKKCFEDFFETKIPCRLPITDNKNLSICSTEESTLDVYKKLCVLIETFSYAEKCNCPTACEEVIHSFNTKYLLHNDETMLKYYYVNNIMVHVEEYYSYTLIPFLCEIGGNLGLFLGLCIPAIIELLQSVVAYLYNKSIKLN